MKQDLELWGIYTKTAGKQWKDMGPEANEAAFSLWREELNEINVAKELSQSLESLFAAAAVQEKDPSKLLIAIIREATRLHDNFKASAKKPEAS